MLAPQLGISTFGSRWVAASLYTQQPPRAFTVGTVGPPV
jgi:hypothetical protein